MAALAAFLAGPASFGENIDPAGDGHQYAWGETVGWINARPSGAAGPGAEVTDAGLTGFLWGENIGWINLSCENQGVCDVTRYGVTNDGFGRLAGFAWGENVGWIDFGPTACAVDPTCGVRIDAATGYFSGRAWGENIGWITFASGAPNEWTTRTSWCQATGGPPGAVTSLVVHAADTELALEWAPAAAASWYDLVGGSLSTLKDSGGDFGAAMLKCFASRTAATSAAIVGPGAAPGDGVWFLVRGSNCRGHGTYDTGSPSQIGSRDLGIASSRRDCP